jgi:hypothetical protein
MRGQNKTGKDYCSASAGMAQLIAQLRTPIAPNEILQFSYPYIEVLSDSLALT